MQKLTVLIAFTLGVTVLSLALAGAELVSGAQVTTGEPAGQTDTAPAQACNEVVSSDSLLARQGCCSWHGGVCV